jgi:hypothetical protein
VGHIIRTKMSNMKMTAIEKFEEMNYAILRDLHSELTGFFGEVKPYEYLVQEAYYDTFALALGNEEMQYEEEPVMLSANDENMLDELKERTRDIIGSSDIFVSDNTLWNMRCITEKKEVKSHH